MGPESCLALSRETAVNQAPAPYFPQQMGTFLKRAPCPCYPLQSAPCGSDLWYSVPDDGHCLTGPPTTTARHRSRGGVVTIHSGLSVSCLPGHGWHSVCLSTVLSNGGEQLVGVCPTTFLNRRSRTLPILLQRLACFRLRCSHV